MRRPAAPPPTTRGPLRHLLVVALVVAIVVAIALRSSVPSTAEEAGAMPDGVTAFDEGHPGVADLDPRLLQALQDATMDAAADGITIYVTSGWRSPEYQEHLLREAVAEHGSEAEARRWVATAATSAHVSGDAVDVGSVDATTWLSAHGSQHGLCPTYANEPWHYELHPEAIAVGCPPPYADPTHDPRMQSR